MFFDTHAHYDSSKFSQDRDETLRAVHDSGVSLIVDPGDTVERSGNALALAHAYDFVYAAVGVHPEEYETWTEGSIEALRALAADKRVVAIGEIGLDYYWDKDHTELQKQMFRAQIELALDLDLPIIVHDREAHGDTMAILKKEGKGLRGVLHCFSGSYEMAQEIYKMGWYIGVDGPLTYKNAAKLTEIVEKFPLERILVETDAPYLAPVPMRGKQNEPAFVRYVAEKVAEIKGISVENVAKQTSTNAEELYGI